MADDTRPAAHPWARVTLDHLTSHPALIVEWVHHRDAQGYPHWMARCWVLRDGEMVAALVPARDVKRVG